MKWLLPCLLAVVTTPVHAQTPFDMSPERPQVEDARPLPNAPAALGTEAAPRAPGSDVTLPTTPASATWTARRYLLPEPSFMLPGETATRSWALHLTAAQAASTARIHLSYRNAVVVAPESSRLQVLLNNVVIIDQAVRSADGFTPIAVDLPAEVLLAGRNEVSMRAVHRHRTDCTIESTYELWTELNAAATYLSFADPAANTFLSMGDLRALSPDSEGVTHVEIVAPALNRNDMTVEILQLTQAIALYASQANITFSTVSAPSTGQQELALRVLLGTPEDLSEIADGVRPGSSAAFLPGDGDTVPTLAISGSNRSEWVNAISQLAAPVDREAGTRRESLITEGWRTPNAPMVYERRSLTFAELGVQSEQFSGRRYVRNFTFAIPADFYAEAYGEAQLLLDAAHAATILPGSSINIYVNGNIASSTPLSQRGGAIYNKLPIKVSMRHFRPGLNEVTIEAALRTEQDDTCLPGASSDVTPRFAIFDTSEFTIPDFGRISQFPNIDATSGTGVPYALSSEPVAVLLEPDSGVSLSAAANVLGRLAVAAGRSVPVSSTTSTDAARQQHALFIGTINSMPAGILGQVGVTEDSRTAWTPATNLPGAASTTEQTNIDLWRRQVERPGLESLGQWFSRTFDITFDMIRFAPTQDAAFNPSQDDVLLVAQGANPSGNGVWTVITAPSQQTLTAGAQAITRQNVWENLSGRVSTLNADMVTVASVPVAASSFVESRPPTIANYRLIAANWLSANILSYSLLLVVACVLLGIATSGLLSRLGRRR
jgi:hypothetical protein